MKIRRAFLLTATATILAIVTNAVGEIRVGDRMEYVEQAMGSPESRARIGQTEMLQYKDGMKITLRNGVVTDVSVRGQLRIGEAVKVVQVPKSSEQPIVNPSRAAASKGAAAPTEKTEPTTPETAAKAEAKPQASSVSNPALTAARATKSQPVVVSVSPKSVAGIIAQIKAVIAGMLLVFVAVAIAVHLFLSYCFKLICEKTGRQPGVLVWIPLAQCIPLLRVAQMREWMLVLLLIPVVNVVFTFMLWAKICAARNKSPWLAATLLIPIVNFFLIPYLAFSPANEQPVEEQTVSEATEIPATSVAESQPEEAGDQTPVQTNAEQTAIEQPAATS